MELCELQRLGQSEKYFKINGVGIPWNKMRWVQAVLDSTVIKKNSRGLCEPQSLGQLVGHRPLVVEFERRSTVILALGKYDIKMERKLRGHKHVGSGI